MSILAVIAALPLSLAADPGAELLRRGDELARAGQHAAACQLWTDAYLKRMPSYRGLPFLRRIEASLQSRPVLRRRLIEAIDEEYPGPKAEADTAAFASFGFFAPTLELRQLLLDLQLQEIAGYYDPDRKSFHVIHETARRSWWEKLLGGGDSDWAERKMVLAHELAHALADQYFDLFSLHSSFEHDDDAALALAALIEGEATLSMLVDLAGPGGRELLQDSGGVANALADGASSLEGFGTGEAFDRAPPIVRETLIFPYVRGLTLCLELTRGERGSWSAVNASFADPPTSTEQVLHPEKYAPRRRRDVPTALSFPPQGPLDKPGWELVKENTLGELQVEVLFRGKLGGDASSKAAAGWDGDTYRLYRRRGSQGEAVLVWASTWDRERDAAELESAARTYWTLTRGPDGPWAVRRQAADVVVVSGPGAGDELTSRLLDWAAGVRRSPKEIRISKAETRVPAGIVLREL
jgi:hypothetical protein